MKINKRIFATLFLVTVLGCILSFVAKKCYHLEQDVCLEQLVDYTEQISGEIKTIFNSNFTYLESISDLLSQSDLQNSSQITEKLSLFSKTELISRFEILLPNDQLLSENGDLFDVSNELSFEKEASLGSHISKRNNDFLNPKSFILRQYTPIIQNGVTKGLLCSVIELNKLPTLLTLKGYGDKMYVYLIESSTGNFLLDTWHEELPTLEELGTRQTKSGYDWSQFISDIQQEKSSTIAFLSQTVNKYFYCYSMPLGIEDWSLSLNVLEEDVFAHAKKVLHFFYITATILLLFFSFDFAWNIRSIQKEKKASEMQLKKVEYMLYVEKELFHAHLFPEHFITALQKVADFLTAEFAFFWISDKQPNITRRLWSNHNNIDFEQDEELLSLFPALLPSLKENGSFIHNHMESFGINSPLIKKIIATYQIHNLMLVPVLDLDGDICLIIGACNMNHHCKDDEALKQVSLGFSKAVSHYGIYQTLSQMGQIDSLTGLMNRNSYHIALDSLPSKELASFACIYLDTNGLHEINNHLGHQAGDHMLRIVAEVLQNVFNKDVVYRIGGDEFVVLCYNRDRINIIENVKLAQKRLEQEGYAVSIGFEWRNSNINTNDIINTAEAAMQQNKREYYKNNGKERQLRTLNEQLEQILLAKQDADTFLNFLASDFKGVYFVNMKTDSIRHLYIPPYFEEILKEANDIFSKALLLYAKRIVRPEFYEQFKQFCDYVFIKEQLESGATPEFTYQKQDHSWLKLQVLKFKNYTDECQETLWIFSNTEEPLNSHS